MRVCIFEDAAVSGLEPLTLTRPAFDLRCGAYTLFERQVRRFGGRDVAALVRPALADLCRQAHPEVAVNDAAWLRDGAVVLVNGRWLPPAVAADCQGPVIGMIGDEIAFVALPAAEAAAVTPENLPLRLEGWKRTLPRRNAGGSLMAFPWDLVEHNGDMLREDFHDWRAERKQAPAPAGVTVLGPVDRVWIDPNAQVEPLVVLDATKGPVLIDRDAVVQAFSRLEGPCYVGPGSHVLGAKLRGGTVGPHCRVGGEVEASILHGHANKAHEGFLGHSYVGEWVNIGAGTQVSDLRTDYGTVRFRVGNKTVDSGLMKVGAFLGDHTKTSINALINTGTMTGPFSQLLTSGGLLPRVVPAFCRVAHGRLQERTDLRELFDTATVVMGRRGLKWTQAHTDFFLSLYEQTEGERMRLLREADQRRLRRVV